MHYDFKGAIIYISSLMLIEVNQLLTTGGLLLNVTYLGYQFYKFHKKNKND